MTRSDIVTASWMFDDMNCPNSRTGRRCRAVLDDLCWDHRWIGLPGQRVAVENVAAGTANAIARAETKHGSPLGGSRRQRKAARTRQVQGLRRYRHTTDREIECLF